MMLKEQINSDLKNAMRSRDKKQLEALRLIMAAAKQIEVDERIEIDDTRMLTILDKLAKQRKESISQFQIAGRDDLASKEQFELDIINRYLPEPLDKKEINKIIKDIITNLDAKHMSDMGKVMAQLKAQLQGRADMSEVSAIVKDMLRQE